MKKRIIASLLMTSVLLCACSDDGHSRRDKNKDKDSKETEVEETESEETEAPLITTTESSEETETTAPVVTESLVPSEYELPDAYAAVVNEIEEAIYLENLDVLDQHIGIEELYYIQGQDAALQNIGVALYDFNNDSVDELFIVDTMANYILSMYTIGGDGSAVNMFDGASRNHYQLMDNMTIHNVSSGGWAYTNIFFLTTAPNGESLEAYDAYFSTDSILGDAPTLDEGTVYWYHAVGANNYDELGQYASYIGTEIDEEIIFPTGHVVCLDTVPIGSFAVG